VRGVDSLSRIIGVQDYRGVRPLFLIPFLALILKISETERETERE
jgi:hypothetical protein